MVYLPRKIRSFHPQVLADVATPSAEPGPPSVSQVRPMKSARRSSPSVPVIHEEVLGVAFSRFPHVPPEVWNHVVAAARDGLKATCAAINGAYEGDVEANLTSLLDQGIPSAVYALGRDVMEGVLRRERGFQGSKLACDSCGSPDTLEFEGDKRRSFLTRLGEVTVRRSYYHCKCGRTAFPLDSILGLTVHDALPAIQETISFLAADLSYAKAQETVQSLLPITISNETVQRITATVAKQIQDEQEEDRRAAFDDPAHASFPQPLAILSNPVATVAVDGGMCRIRDQEDYREFRVAVMGTVDPTKATLDQPASVEDKHYVAHFADADRVFEYLAVEYHRQGLDQCSILHLLGDGADWIWSRGKSLCGSHQKYIPTLDFWHSAERISDLAKTLHGPETPVAQEWSKSMRDLLLEDHVDAFLAKLEALQQQALERRESERAEAIRAQLDFFRERRTLLNYAQCRAMGLPIGSGIVEGGVRFVGKDRLHRTGMRWLVDGAEAILQLRATDASGDRATFCKRQTAKRLQGYLKQKKAWQRAA